MLPAADAEDQGNGIYLFHVVTLSGLCQAQKSAPSV